MKRSIIGGVLCVMFVTSCGVGSVEPPRGEHSKARATAFKRLSGEMQVLGGVVKGNSAYDVQRFKELVGQFAEKSKLPFQHFSRDGNGLDGNARDAVWSNASGFKQEEEKFQNLVSQLNKAAESGKLNEIKPAFSQVAASCKSCHKTFKLK